MKIGSKFVFVMLVAAFMIIGLSGFFIYTQVRKNFYIVVGNQLEGMASIQEARLNLLLDRFTDITKVTAANPELKKELASYNKTGDIQTRRRINKELHSIKNNLLYIQAIAVLDNKGGPVASTDASQAGIKNSADKALQKDGGYCGYAGVVKGDNNIPLLQFTCPIIRDGEVIGVLNTLNAGTEIVAITGDFTGLGQTGETIIAKRDENGDALIIAPNRYAQAAAFDSKVPKNELAIPITQALLKQEIVLENNRDYRGVEVVAATRYIDKADWGLVVKFDKSEVMGPLVRSRNIITASCFVSAFILMGFVFYYTTQISKLFMRIIDEERKKLIEILEATSDFVAAADPDGRVTYFNVAARNMLGLRAGEDSSTVLFTETHPEWAKDIVLKEAIPAAVRDGSWTGETAILSRAGNIIPVLQTIIAHKSPDGSLKYLSTIARDITERKRVEEKLRVSEAELSVANSGMKKLFTAIEQAGQGIVITAIDGTILYVNPAFTEITDYAADEAVGKTPRILNSGMNPPELFEDLWKTILSGRKWSGTIINKKKRGEIYYEEIVISPVMNDAGAITNFIGIKTDITERKKLEDELKLSRDKLRALASYLEGAREEERTRIAREVHDELGQELTRLSLDLFALTSSLKRSNIQQKAQFLEKTDCISEGIDLITEKVHTIAMELRPGMLDHLGLAAAIEWQAGEFQKKNDIQCKFEVKEYISIENTISTALFRILQEALTNILRHSNATKVDLRLWKEDGLVCLEIADNGKGITDEELQSVHSLGFLGMKERANALGGFVDISGRIGAGTTVTARIPFKE